MRVYIPATWPMLRKLVANDRLDPVGGTAFALTPKLRESYTAGDEEELEYAAMGRRRGRRCACSRWSSGWGRTPRRRGAWSWPRTWTTSRCARTWTTARCGIRGPVELSTIAAVHVDTADAEFAVRQAAGVIDAADLGDLDAEFLIGEAEDHELAWYDPSEVAFLVELG